MHKFYKMSHIHNLEKNLSKTRKSLINHNLYSKLNSKQKLIDFMENHVFAVWDFMSLIKALQKNLTCVDVPWVPNENRLAGRLVNEIVLAEESDVDSNGDPKSHFELYLESMNKIGASTKIINDFISKIKNSKSYSNSIDKININPIVKEFMDFTFNIINTNKNHVIASVFTFGREDLIPDMFIEIENDEVQLRSTPTYLTTTFDNANSVSNLNGATLSTTGEYLSPATQDFKGVFA